MKGIILAGGNGTRLYPLTKVVNKHLLPIWNKPMIIYPLELLIKVGIKDILIISTPISTPLFQELIGDGESYGVNISYIVQPEPIGIPDAFKIGRTFIGNDKVTLVLGDNIFESDRCYDHYNNALKNHSGATLFGYSVADPERFGVIQMNKQHVIGLEEKPSKPKSNYVATGLYIYDNDVIDAVKQLHINSSMKEYSITDLNMIYLRMDKLKVSIIHNCFWLDVGTFESLLKANMYFKGLDR